MAIPLDNIPSITILNVRIHLVRMDQVLNIIQHWIETRENCRYIVATQMHGIMEARRDPDFREALNSADLFVPDGFSVKWAARMYGVKLNDRVPGPDLFFEGCKLAAQHGYRVFFYGDTDETLARLTSKLKDLIPDLEIAGVHSPPFRKLTETEDAAETKMINESGADIVWVGLGLPKQERWMYQHREKLNASVLVGVGAAFKFLSGGVKRAPPWMGDRGFEWVWRFILEPRRVWRRVMIDGPYFFLCAAKESFSSKISGR